MIKSTFEQFEINPLSMISFFPLGFFTNLFVLLVVFLNLVYWLVKYVVSTFTLLPKENNAQRLIEGLYNFTFSMLKEQGGKLSFKYYPHFLTVFILILLFNVSGLFPFGFTITSHFTITLTLALGFVFTWIIIGLIRQRLNWFLLFYPANMPLWLRPLLCIIEVLSYILRPFSLSIRLFANMLAGHILLHLVIGAFSLALQYQIILVLPVLATAVGVSILELGIAFLQAYIYTLLLIIYFKDSLINHS